MYLVCKVKKLEAVGMGWHAKWQWVTWDLLHIITICAVPEILGTIYYRAFFGVVWHCLAVPGLHLTVRSLAQICCIQEAKRKRVYHLMVTAYIQCYGVLWKRVLNTFDLAFINHTRYKCWMLILRAFSDFIWKLESGRWGAKFTGHNSRSVWDGCSAVFWGQRPSQALE